QPIADIYGKLFDAAWTQQVKAPAFKKDKLSTQNFSFPKGKDTVEISFAPHDKARAKAVLDGLATRIQAEGKKSAQNASVLFAVMETDKGTGPVLAELKSIHRNDDVFSFGITDST